MLWPMQIRLDTWGRWVAIALGVLLPIHAEAQAEAPPDAREALTLAMSEDDIDLFDDEDVIEDVAIEGASEWGGVEVAMGTPPERTTADYDLALDQDPSAVAEFQDVLAPYGTWAEDGTYGTVWIPDADVVGNDFAPYVTAGHWALTSGDEWLWVSDYDWGWAPFHYGRWVWISGRGWAWIPGRVYAPAWVVWRTGYYDDYYVGWAPMPPTWYWRGGVAVSLWAVPPAPYVFCAAHSIWRPHVHRHIVPAARVRAVASHTRPYYAATPAGRRSFSSYVRGPSTRDSRIPATAAPRAEHHPRAIAAAKPVPGGRLGATGRTTATPRVGATQPRVAIPLPSQTRPNSARPVRPSAPGSVDRRITPRPSLPQARPSPTPAPRSPSVNPHRSPTPSPSPRLAPTPRPSPPPRFSPTPAPRPAPRPPMKAPSRTTPAPTRIAPRAATRPSVSPSRSAPNINGGRR